MPMTITMTSRRNSSEAAASAPLSHYNHQGVRERWPVLIYRLQSHRGWEVYCDPDMEAAATTAAATTSSAKKASAAANKSTKAGAGDTADAIEELTVAPREGCIEVRKMRLRIRLFQQHTPWDPNQPSQRSGGQSSKDGEAGRGGKDGNELATQKEGANSANADHDKNNDDDGYNSDIPGADGWNNNALLVRRRNTLLVTTRRGWGAVVFQFKSTQDCIDFCDRLVYLNRDILNPRNGDVEDTGISTEKRARIAEDGGYVNGMDKRDLQIDNMRGIKRRKLAMLGDVEVRAPSYGASSSLQQNPGADCFDNNMTEKVSSGLSEESTIQYQRQEEIMSYIVRLAHSEEFRGFVDEIERGLESAEDTVGIHAALGF